MASRSSLPDVDAGRETHTKSSLSGRCYRSAASTDADACLEQADSNTASEGTSCSGLKPRWPLLHHSERPLHHESGTPERSLIEKLADQGHAMRHAARGREGRKRMLGIRRPIAPRLRYLDEPGSHRQRRVASEVRDRQHLVAQRWHQEQIHLGENALHLGGYPAPHPVGLHEVDCREESCLAELIRPRVRHLRLELIYLMAQGQLLKGGGGLAEQDHVERVERPVW